MALAATVSVAQVGGPARTEQEAETRRKLEAVRAQLRTLADEQRATRGERSEAERQLRERELAIARIAGELQDLDARVASEQRELDGLEARRKEFEQALRAQRDALAALLRSAYALGRDQELKLLLQQDDVAAIARVLAYHRYFQRSRIERIDRVRADLAHLADVEAAIATTTAALDEVRAARRTEVQRLEAERTRHEALVAEIDARLGDQRARILALGRDEAELAALLERLRDVFAPTSRRHSTAIARSNRCAEACRGRSAAACSRRSARRMPPIAPAAASFSRRRPAPPCVRSPTAASRSPTGCAAMA